MLLLDGCWLTNWLRGCSVAKPSDWIWKSGRKNAFLPNNNLSRVCGFVIARTCAIWSLHIEMESEPGASSSILKWRQELHFRSCIVANILAYYSGVLRAVRGTSNFWGCADEITPNQRILNWIWCLQIATELPLKQFFGGDDFTFFCVRSPSRKSECPNTNKCIVRDNRGLAMGIDYWKKKAQGNIS